MKKWSMQKTVVCILLLMFAYWLFMKGYQAYINRYYDEYYEDFPFLVLDLERPDTGANEDVRSWEESMNNLTWRKKYDNSAEMTANVMSARDFQFDGQVVVYYLGDRADSAYFRVYSHDKYSYVYANRGRAPHGMLPRLRVQNGEHEMVLEYPEGASEVMLKVSAAEDGSIKVEQDPVIKWKELEEFLKKESPVLDFPWLERPLRTHAPEEGDDVLL